MVSNLTAEISTALRNLSSGFIIGLFVEVLISSFTLYLSVKLVGGKPSFKKSILLTTIMEIVNLVVLPIFTTGFFSLLLYILIWLALVTVFFEISIWKAILVTIVQVIVTLIFVALSIAALIATTFGTTFP